MHNPKITVGIPAYNEEGNIGSLVSALLEQDQFSFTLSKIIIASDGSTDKTEAIVRGFADTRVKLLADGKREGQGYRQNQIISEFEGDILVLLNGDVLPCDQQFLENIIKPFSLHENLGIVSGKPTPVKPETFFERIINHSVQFKDYLVGQINGGHNILNCHGSVRAFSRDFITDFKWKGAVSEDAYSYLSCKQRGFMFRFEPNAAVYRRSPQNFYDHVKQSGRFDQGQVDLMKYFPEEVVVSEHAIPLGVILKSIIVYFLKNPVLMSGYLLIGLYSKIMVMMKGNYAVVKWEPSASSKRLVK